jgi:hypothetical protein
MVLDHVWVWEAGLAKQAGVAHLDCLADRIDRPVGVDDLADIPFNIPIRQHIELFGPVLPNHRGAPPGGTDG